MAQIPYKERDRGVDSRDVIRMPDGDNYQRDRNGAGTSPAPVRPTSIATFLSTNGIAFSLIALLLVALLDEMPWVGRSVRELIMRALLALSLTFIVAVRPVVVIKRRELLQGTTPWILALTTWCIGEVVLPPTGYTPLGAALRPFAITELMRMVFCVAIYFIAAYYVPANQVRTVLLALFVAGAAVGIFGFVQYGQGPHGTGGDEMTSIFGNHEQVASYLLMLLPAALTIAVCKSEGQTASLIASATALVVGGCLLLARTRSAWLGAAFGIGVLIALVLRYSRIRFTSANRYMIVGPALVLVIALSVLAGSGVLSPMLAKRAATFSALHEDTSLSIRLHRWKAASRMLGEKPFTGWGLGAYPVIERHWTGTGDSPDHVIQYGTGHSNLAHNFWVQWASETGAIGLGLYVAMFMSFIVFALRALQSSISQSSKTMLFVGIASIAATAVDMVGAPSYTFPGVSSLPWLWMGLAVASVRPGNETLRDSAATTTPAWAVVVPIAASVVVVALVLWVGFHQPNIHYR